MPVCVQRIAAFVALTALLWLATAHRHIAAETAEPMRSSRAPTDARSPDLVRVAHRIIGHTDELRKAHGNSTTGVSAQLAGAAQSFAQFMARTDQHGHEVDGSTPAARAKQSGFNFCMVSENIAFQFSSAGFATDELARRFVEGWKNSPGHRKNMLDPDAMETGTAVARSPRTGRYYAVQMFGRPRSAMLAFQISNLSDSPAPYQIGGRLYELPVRGTRTHQHCRSEPITVQGASAEAKSSVQPADRDRFAIVRDRQGLRLVQQ